MPPPQHSRPEIAEEQGLPIRRLQRSEQLRALAHPHRMEIIDLSDWAIQITEAQLVELGSAIKPWSSPCSAGPSPARRRSAHDWSTC